MYSLIIKQVWFLYEYSESTKASVTEKLSLKIRHEDFCNFVMLPQSVYSPLSFPSTAHLDTSSDLAGLSVSECLPAPFSWDHSEKQPVNQRRSPEPPLSRKYGTFKFCSVASE